MIYAKMRVRSIFDYKIIIFNDNKLNNSWQDEIVFIQRARYILS